jgi:exodeoxyribonuclease VII small subunit
MKRLVGRASVPAAFGGTGFQPVCRTGKMPVPPRTFPNRKPKTENRKNTMAKEKKQGEPSFEAGLKRLEEVLDALEHGDLSLEEAMRAFEEGVQLVRVCHKKLDEVEKRVELLLKNDAGRFFTRPFPEEEGEA